MNPPTFWRRTLCGLTLALAATGVLSQTTVRPKVDSAANSRREME